MPPSSTSDPYFHEGFSSQERLSEHVFKRGLDAQMLVTSLVDPFGWQFENSRTGGRSDQLAGGPVSPKCHQMLSSTPWLAVSLGPLLLPFRYRDRIEGLLLIAEGEVAVEDRGSSPPGRLTSSSGALGDASFLLGACSRFDISVIRNARHEAQSIQCHVPRDPLAQGNPVLLHRDKGVVLSMFDTIKETGTAIF